jgi:hypothetical protein
MNRWRYRGEDDLVSFLLARLEDDEIAARTLIGSGETLPFESSIQTSDHASRHGPVRILREVAAKRAMVQMWQDGLRARAEQFPVAGLDIADAMITALVAVHADHPDFDPDWMTLMERPDPHPGDQPDNVIHLPLAD